MTDPYALLDTYAVGHEIQVNGMCIDREDHAEAAFVALRAVLDLHPPTPGLPGTDQFWCLCCWTPSEGAMAPVRWPCPTSRAITNAIKEDR